MAAIPSGQKAESRLIENACGNLLATPDVLSWLAWLQKKSPGTWHVGAQGGRDDDLGCWGDEGIAVSFSIIDKHGFITVNSVTQPFGL